MITRSSLQHENRSPYACPLDETRLRLMVKAKTGELKSVTVRYGDRYAPIKAVIDAPLRLDGSDGLHDYWVTTVEVPTRRARYWFHLRRGRENLWWGEGGFDKSPKDLTPFQFPYLTTADLFQQPDWLDGTTVYQIFPDRFYNGDPANDPDGPRLAWGAKPRGGEEMAGGDLEGLRQKLDYLADLGVGAFYTTPIFKSSSNHKYNTEDYYAVDPAFGTNELFRQLVEEAHERDLRILLDAVFNHSGSNFFAFKDVMKNGEKSKYVKWFNRIDSFPVDPSIPNYETFGPGYGYMPKLNTADPDCAEYLLEVGEFWLKEAGIDGWRLDVANEVDHVFWRRFRERVKSAHPDAWILGEIWHAAQDWLQGDEFDSVMNYPWRDATLAFLTGKADAEAFDEALRENRYLYSPQVTAGLLNLLGSHDTPRIRTVVGSAKLARLAAALEFTMPGIPLIYYGDEIGMKGGPDPDCRRCMKWNEEKQDNKTLGLYKDLIRLRKENPWLMGEGYETLLADNGSSVYAYRRTEDKTGAGRSGSAIEVYINAGKKSAKVELDRDRPMKRKDARTGKRLRPNARLALPPQSFRLVLAESG
jgi:glycosidase